MKAFFELSFINLIILDYQLEYYLWSWDLSTWWDKSKKLLNWHTCCEGVDNASISLPTIGFTLGSDLSRCLASEPIRITTLCLTASYDEESGASSKNVSNTGSSLVTFAYRYERNSNIHRALAITLKAIFRDFWSTQSPFFFDTHR